MRKIEDILRNKYKIKDSIKEYKGYKVRSPQETIKIIEKSFQDINLHVVYEPKEKQIIKPYSPFQSGSASLYSKENDEIFLLKSGGKGVTPILARASATAELMERFTGYGLAQGHISHYLSFFKYDSLWIKKRKRNQLVKKLFPLNNLETDKIVSPEYKKKVEPLAKSICYSLTNDKLYSYPEEFITVIEGSNGLASGNTYEEAAIHAINEEIERLVGFYVLDQLPKYKEICPDSATHPTLKKLMRAVNSTGIKYKILDFSHVFDIPVIITISYHPEWNYESNPYTDVICEYPKMQIGVDTDPQDAAMRCFTEIIQAADPILIAKYNYETAKNKFEISGIKTCEQWELYLRTTGSTFQNGNHPKTVDLLKYLENSCKEKVTFQDIKSMYDINHKVEIKNVVQKLKNHNIEIFVHDITNPILKFPVVRAMLTGGKDYFSKIPFVGYKRLIIGTDDENEKRAFLNHIIKNTYGSQIFYQTIRGGDWCHSEDQSKFINCVKGNISFTGIEPPLWGKKIDKFYFLGMLYLKEKKIQQAETCFLASLYHNFNDIAPLVGLLYVYSKQGREKEFEYLMGHFNVINRYNIDIEKALKDMDNPVIDPNPFVLCDLDCKKKNNQDLCKNCFFNYASEDVFMKDSLADILKL